MMSDESENDGVYVENYENDVYYKKYKFLLERCEAIQKHNERLVFRIQEVKKITKRRYEQVQYLKDKLLKEYGEDWKIIPKFPTFDEDIEDEKPNISQLNTVKVKEEKVDDGKYAAVDVKPSRFVESEEKPKLKKTKRKTPKAERDPNAPKRPSNPFFYSVKSNDRY
ncbi:tcf3 fusion partner [Holotrichia oblita]|uniref:Tcf3 fusion partner n=1 Tax=Holotrichia oblita TaxID=644536 RepID=A0ACB9SNG5_HOLOL|nr:tcf3 fusion partner [Holotrichia oblita]